jgi:CheY-like chemotaxis protein
VHRSTIGRFIDELSKRTALYEEKNIIRIDAENAKSLFKPSSYEGLLMYLAMHDFIRRQKNTNPDISLKIKRVADVYRQAFPHIVLKDNSELEEILARNEILDRGYIKRFELLIDASITGKPVVVKLEFNDFSGREFEMVLKIKSIDILNGLDDDDDIRINAECFSCGSGISSALKFFKTVDVKTTVDRINSCCLEAFNTAQPDPNIVILECTEEAEINNIYSSPLPFFALKKNGGQGIEVIAFRPADYRDSHYFKWISDSIQIIKPSYLKNFYDRKREEAAGYEENPASSGRFTSLSRMLIIEDDPGVLKSLAELMKDMGLKVFTAATFEEAEKQLLTSVFDAVLCDLYLNARTGFQLLNQYHENFYFIIMSGFADREQVIRAFRAGASDFLLKPLSEKELSLCLKRADGVLSRTGK